MTSYYVDATSGLDTNSGTSESAAWQTISKVNSSTYATDDRILFKRGETWTGTMLVIDHSNLYIGSYGSSSVLPIIDGNDLVDCIGNSGTIQNVTIDSIEVTQGYDFGFYFTGACHDIYLINCVTHDCGNDNAIFIDGAYNGYVYNLTTYNATARAAGPRISGFEVADGAHDIYVYGIESYDNAHAGITIHSHPTTEMPYNVTIIDADCYDNLLFGIVIAQDNASATLPDDANIIINNGSFNENGTGAGTGGGIWISNTGDPYPAGIEFNNCESYSITANTDRPVYVGGKATFNNCLFRATFGARCEGTTSAGIFYNCIFYRAANTVFDTTTSIESLVMRNCIFYSTGSGIIIINIRPGNVFRYPMR